MLVLLHGVGGNEQNLLSLSDSFDDRFQTISARAPLTFAPGSYGWFQVQFTPEPVINAAQAEASRTQLIAFLERIVVQDTLDESQVFLVGFSQGAIIGASVALTRPDLVAGLVMLSGRILPEVKPLIASRTELEGVSVFVAHGHFDTKLPIHHAKASLETLERLGVRVRYREYEMGHEINPQEIQEVSQWLASHLDARVQPEVHSEVRA